MPLARGRGGGATPGGGAVSKSVFSERGSRRKPKRTRRNRKGLAIKKKNAIEELKRNY